MDYHVFLLSRIRERYGETGSIEDAVTHGITSSVRLITGAALIMVAVFGGFAAGDLVMFQQMGFGLAVAVLVDATLVRTILVPATMTLLGRHDWYLPRFLGWLPRVSFEGERHALSAAMPLTAASTTATPTHWWRRSRSPSRRTPASVPKTANCAPSTLASATGPAAAAA